MLTMRRSIQSGPSFVAVGLIRMHRRYLSPIKGYKCAYSYHGMGPSCSTYGLRVFTRLPPTTAYALLRRKFQRCSRTASKRSQKREWNPLCIPFYCCAEKCDNSRNR